MDQYVTGSTIKRIREEKQLTQAELADRLGVTPKAVSKWETGKGYPDIALLEPIAQALGISVIELMSGVNIENKNVSGNMLRSKIYVCPVCGNIIHSLGETLAVCCGITLPSLEVQDMDEEHPVEITPVEDEIFVEVKHSMTKEHYISFIAFVYDSKFEMVKLYPEGNAECRFKKRGSGHIYIYCNKHGLMKLKLRRG